MSDPDARRALLGELFDDAGLFPPASLSMEQAASGHETSRRSEHAWMLGRFVCPASRLAELVPHLSAQPWRLTVIVDGDGTAADVREFGAAAADRARIEQFELRLPGGDPSRAADALALAESAGLPAAVYLEVPAGDLSAVEAVAKVGAGVKIRCGGDSPPSVPSPRALAQTLATCRDLGVRVKATAGLHHPFRHVDVASGVLRHGFVNLAAAAAFAVARDASAATLESVLEDVTPGSFALDAHGFSWLGERVGSSDCAAARASLLAGIGSCSFDEPVEDLLAMGVLPA